MMKRVLAYIMLGSLALVVLASSSAITSPIVRYASVVSSNGAPTAGNGFQASTGVLYVDRSTGSVYVKTGAPATSWSTVTSTSAMSKLALSPLVQSGYNGNHTAGSLYQTINNWSPGPGSLVVMQGADNAGTGLTDMDATGFSDGDIRFILNGESRSDAGVVVLKNEDTGSTATNRFVTPESHDYYIGPQGFAIVVRRPLLDTNGDPTADHRWHVVGTARVMRSVTQDLHLYPPLDVGTITPISGTFNDWEPTGDFPTGYSARGLAASNRSWTDHTVVRVGTDAAGATVTGFKWYGPVQGNADVGPVKIIQNFGPGTLTIKHQSLSSTADDRINTPCLDDLAIPASASVIFYHPITSSGWLTWAASSPSRLCGARSTLTPTDSGQPALSVTMIGGENHGIQITNSATGQNPAGGVSNGISVAMSGTYNATTQGHQPSAFTATCTATRSAGANVVDCNALNVSASGCSGGTCRALLAAGGEVRLQSGSPFIAGDTADLVGNVSTYANNRLGDANPDRTNIWGHVVGEGTTPTLSSCGTTPSITGSDLAGSFTTGTGGTTCTITFSRTYTVEPACIISPKGTATNPTCTESATAITCSTTVAGTKYKYHCIAPTSGT